MHETPSPLTPASPRQPLADRQHHLGRDLDPAAASGPRRPRRAPVPAAPRSRRALWGRRAARGGHQVTPGPCPLGAAGRGAGRAQTFEGR